MKKEISGILVDMDSLFDTRLSVLVNNYPEEMLKDMLVNYTVRTADRFSNVTLEEFKELYSKRSKKDIFNTGVTGVTFLLNDFCKKTIKLNYQTHYDIRPKVYLNVYPYDLTDSEKDILTKSLFIVCDKLADIEIVNYNYSVLTPTFVNNTFSTMVMYDYDKWLISQAENFKTKGCPSVTLMAPKLYFINPDIETKDNPFKILTESLESIISLKLLDISTFCDLKCIA